MIRWRRLEVCQGEDVICPKRLDVIPRRGTTTTLLVSGDGLRDVDGWVDFDEHSHQLTRLPSLIFFGRDVVCES
jgi:hypothetical protein